MALKYDFTEGTVLVRYLGGLSGDADVTDAEITSIRTFMDSKSSTYAKYDIEPLDTGAVWLVVDFRDVDEKNEFRALVWNTSERRNATVGTQPYNKKGTTNDGSGHPSHKDATMEILETLEE